MKKNANLQKDDHGAIRCRSSLNAAETGDNTKISRHLKKFIYLVTLAGIGLFFSGCYVGYVATEPAYVVVARPPQPSNTHIWVDGNWTWNRQTNSYVQKTGYWERPNQGRTFVPGHWQATPRGQYWVSGRLQKQNHQVTRRYR